MRIFVFVVLMFSSLFICFPSSSYAGEGRNFILRYYGETREYIVHFPKGKGNRSGLPVVIVFHGGGGSAEGAASQTQMHVMGDKYGFITVYPQGTESRSGKFRTWNAVECCGSAARQNVDDVGFVSEMIEVLHKKFSIDRDRIYATGHSNGAMMSYRLACALSEKITAIAPNAGVLALDDCKPARPVPVLHMHGTEDQCALYKGGNCGGCFAEMLGFAGRDSANNTRQCKPVPEVLGQMAQVNGCKPATRISRREGSLTCTEWAKCKEPVTLCTIQGAGHVWPGADQYGPKFCQVRENGRLCQKYKNIIGSLAPNVPGNEIMWAFFSEHKMPPLPGPKKPE